MESKDNSFNLVLKHHPSSATLRSTDQGLFKALASNKRLLKWVNAVEPDAMRSLKLRVLLGEAAHFVADSACALGRGKAEEVLPLFLFGLAKLNDVFRLINGNTKQPEYSTQPEVVAQSPNYGVAMVQSVLLGSTEAARPWDILEVLVKSESTFTAHQLLIGLVGQYLLERTHIYVSTHAVVQVKFPSVLIHPFVGVRAQTDAVLSGIRRTQAFLRDGEVSQSTTDRLLLQHWMGRVGAAYRRLDYFKGEEIKQWQLASLTPDELVCMSKCRRSWCSHNEES